MIYLPEEITIDNCAYVYDSNTIRVYEEIPRTNSTINYTDYFVNSHYMSRTGSTTFNNYSTINYNCLDYTKFTTSYQYRNDIADILIISLIIIGVIWFLVSKPIRCLFRGFRRY